MDFQLSMLAVSCWWLLLVANSATHGRVTRKHQETSRYNQENYPSMTPDSLRPRPRLMCAELCFAGLGGPPCGQRCSNITDLPETFTEDTENSMSNYSEAMYTPIVGPRKKVCPTLCQYGLGQPLCGCKFQEKKEISWLLICSSYCHLENLQLYGCPICDVVPLLSRSGPLTMMTVSSNFATFDSNTDPDWNKICYDLCQVADGGSACNCDFPPF